MRERERERERENFVRRRKWVYKWIDLSREILLNDKLTIVDRLSSSILKRCLSKAKHSEDRVVVGLLGNTEEKRIMEMKKLKKYFADVENREENLGKYVRMIGCGKKG